MSRLDPTSEPLPYAHSLHRGVEPATLYRIIAIAGGLNAIGRFATPVRFIGNNPLAAMSSLRIGIPYVSVTLSLLTLLLSLYSAVVLLIVSIGLLTGNRRIARWLWTSEPAAMLSALLVYDTTLAGFLQRNLSMPPGYLAGYLLNIFSSVSLPIALLLLLRAGEAAERGERI